MGIGRWQHGYPRLAIALACFALAAALHVLLCEWRTFEFSAEEARRIEARVILALRRAERDEGNAAAWDRQDAALDAYNAAWGRCYAELHGTPASDGPMGRCLEGRRFPRETPTSGAVARVACERELYGDVRERPTLERCLEAAGHEPTHLPCWTSERIGRRFDGPHTRLTALLAEARAMGHGVGRPLAVVLGIAVPGALVAGGVLALRSRPR